MDIDMPPTSFPSSASTEPMFTPGGKRKRGFEQDVMQESGPDQVLDEGSAAKQLRTLPPSAFNPTPISPFPFSRTQSQVQTPNTDVFGSTPIQSTSTQNVFNPNTTNNNPPDYFSRPLPTLHDQSAPRLTNLTPNSDPSSNSNTNLGTNQLAVQSFSQDLFPPVSPASGSGSRVGLMQPRSNSSGNADPNTNISAGSNGAGVEVGVMNPGAGQDTTGMNMSMGMDMGGDQGMMVDAGTGIGMGTALSTPGLAEEVEKARNVHGPQCKTIPRLFLSDHPDPATGKRSMWAQCNSCGSIEMVPDQA